MALNLCKVIQTDSGRLFVYDGLTSRIISVGLKKALREKISEALESEIIFAVSRQGLLLAGKRESARCSIPFEFYKAALSSEIPHLVLQTTRNCNLNCAYCVYSGNYSHVRPSAAENMPLATMLRSIDFYAAHSRSTAKAAISFYGGEPLLRFREIVDATEYAKKIFQDKPLEILLSTNGVLLQSQIYNWLRDNPNIKLVMTLNGPFHDRYRRDFAGGGTLEVIMRGVETLKTNYPEVWRNQLIFIANFNSFTEVAEILRFYREQVGLEGQPLFFTKIRRDMGNDKIQKILQTDARKEQAARQSLRQEYYSNPEGLLSSLYKSNLEMIDEREIFAPGAAMRVESCAPFSVKLFVRTDGKFNVCERTSDSFVLGDLERGFDEAAIERAMAEVAQLINRNCRDCWAQRLCLLCFQQMVDENGQIRQQIPEQLCRDMRENLYELLQMYCELYG